MPSYKARNKNHSLDYPTKNQPNYTRNMGLLLLDPDSHSVTLKNSNWFGTDGLHCPGIYCCPGRTLWLCGTDLWHGFHPDGWFAASWVFPGQREAPPHSDKNYQPFSPQGQVGMFCVPLYSHPPACPFHGPGGCYSSTPQKPLLDASSKPDTRARKARLD